LSQFNLRLILIYSLWLLSPNAPSASSSSSRIRKRFHNRSKFDNDGPLYRYAARRNDASNFVRIIASRKPLSYLVIAMTVPWSSMQRMAIFARDMTLTVRSGQVWLLSAAPLPGTGSEPFLICEVVGRLILTALRRDFKLRTFI